MGLGLGLVPGLETDVVAQVETRENADGRKLAHVAAEWR